MEIEFRNDMTVELVRANASDADVVFAARVSTVGEASLEDTEILLLTLLRSKDLYL